MCPSCVLSLLWHILGIYLHLLMPITYVLALIRTKGWACPDNHCCPLLMCLEQLSWSRLFPLHMLLCTASFCVNPASMVFFYHGSGAYHTAYP